MGFLISRARFLDRPRAGPQPLARQRCRDAHPASPGLKLRLCVKPGSAHQPVWLRIAPRRVSTGARANPAAIRPCACRFRSPLSASARSHLRQAQRVGDAHVVWNGAMQPQSPATRAAFDPFYRVECFRAVRAATEQRLPGWRGRSKQQRHAARRRWRPGNHCVGNQRGIVAGFTCDDRIVAPGEPACGLKDREVGRIRTACG